MTLTEEASGQQNGKAPAKGHADAEVNTAPGVYNEKVVFCFVLAYVFFLFNLEAEPLRSELK